MRMSVDSEGCDLRLDFTEPSQVYRTARVYEVVIYGLRTTENGDQP
jgi:hypothetical protein